jgi:hypothetical protein
MIKIGLESLTDSHVWYIDDLKKDRIVQFLLDIQEEE